MISLRNSDFSKVIQAIQTVVQGSSDIQKIATAQLNAALADFVHSAQSHNSNVREQKHFLTQSNLMLNEPLARPGIGPTLIYGSRSSPLLRLLPVLYALKNRCPVVFLCNPSLHDAYQGFFELLVQKGIPDKALSLVSTVDKEALETLIAHPSLKAIYFNGHLYEGEFLKSMPLPVFQKRIRIHLGGRNPIIFTHDAELEKLRDLLTIALDTTYLAEHSFNRWFVQEKNFAAFVKVTEDLLPQIPVLSLAPDLQYEQALNVQNQTLLKEKNWKISGRPFNPDFNNCSSWQQTEVLGSLLTITRFKNVAEAVKFANTTQYASAGVVFSSTAEKAKEIASQLIMPHRFSQEIPDMGLLARTSGLSESGFGLEQSNKDFFVF